MAPVLETLREWLDARRHLSNLASAALLALCAFAVVLGGFWVDVLVGLLLLAAAAKVSVHG